MAMDCQFCGKSFNKGEHLRRHERGHTGYRPFTCQQCKRTFTRQDSLLRHQKVHSKSAAAAAAAGQTKTTSSPSKSLPSTAEDDGEPNRPPIMAMQHFTHAADEPMPSTAVQSDVPGATFPPPDNAMNHMTGSTQFQYDESLGFQDEHALADMDLTLMWPDSEDLFNSIFSVDFNGNWQLPPGTLPLPSAMMTPVGGPLVEPTNSNSANMQSGDGQMRSGDNRGAVLGVSQMVSNYSSSLTAAVESKSITSVFLDECLHMFFDRFIPIFPIMHRPTFVYRDCSHALLLNAIAIGSLYLGPSDSVAKGEVLWRLAHTAVATSWQTLISHQGPYDACPGVQLVLASLLSVVYGALSKSTGIRAASQALHASAFFWARQCGIFNCKPYDLTELPAMSAPHAEKVHQWKIWAAREIQQRALLSHFVLDGLISHMQGNSTSVRHTSNTLRVPHSERAFQDTVVDEWLRRMYTLQQDQHTFRDIYKRLFVRSDSLWMVSQGCSNFSLRVLLEGLQSMIADSDADDGGKSHPIIHPPNSAEIGNALSWIYEKISTCNDITEVEKLEVTMRWHAVCLENFAKTPQLCNYICKRWNAKQDLWPNNNLRDQEYDLPKLVNSSEGRKALLHAVAIQDIVEQLPRGRAHAVHMPSSLFAAATIYGIFSFTGQTNVRIPRTVEWKDVVLAASELENINHETANYIRVHRFSLGPASTTSRNVLYELNSVQKLFRSLTTQWGVSSDMEKVVSQWIALCHI